MSRQIVNLWANKMVSGLSETRLKMVTNNEKERVYSNFRLQTQTKMLKIYTESL